MKRRHHQCTGKEANGVKHSRNNRGQGEREEDEKGWKRRTRGMMGRVDENEEE